MKLFWMVFIFFFLIFVKSYSAEPVVKVPPLPPANQLELYEESEGLFSIMVMDYNDRAVALRSQLLMMGIEPKTKIFPPSYEELEEMDIKLIKKYYKWALALSAEVETAPETPYSAYKKYLKDTINYFTTRQWEIMNDCIEDKIALINEKDSIYNYKLSKLEEMQRQKARAAVDVISVCVAENQFVANGDGKIESFPSLSLQLAISTYKLFGFWRGLEIWYEYMSPRFTTKTAVINQIDTTTLIYKEKWNTDLHAIGINGNIKPLFDWGHYGDGLRLGFGYFWAKGNIWNRENIEFKWEGIRIELKYFAGPPLLSLPLEIVFGGQLYQSLNESLMFNTQIPGSNPINIGRTHIALTLGLRYNFWKSAY